MEKKLLVMPIEVKVREFIHKLFLSFHVLKNTDFKIIIGGQRFITNKIKIQNSLWFDKNTFFVDRQKTPVHLDNNKIIMLDEEGPVSFFDKVNLKERYSDKIKNQVKYFIFNGENDIRKIKKNYLTNKKYFIMGNPKYDIIKENCQKIHSKQINVIKKRYKNFLFVTGHFGMSQLESSYVKQSLKATRNYSVNNFKDKMKSIENCKKNYFSLINLTKRIAEENKDLTIIFRKHPTENDQQIKELFGKIPKNLKLIYKYSVTPWLFSCRYHLHSGCQTSLESAVLNKKIITFMPSFSDSSFENYKRFSPFFRDEKKCLSFFKNKKFKNVSFYRYKHLSKIVINIKKNVFFYEKFIYFVKREFKDLNSNYSYKKDKNNFLKKITLNILSVVKNNLIKYEFIRNILPYNIIVSKQTKLTKFSKIQKSEILYYLRIFSKIYNYRNSFSVKKISLNVFEISKK